MSLFALHGATVGAGKSVARSRVANGDLIIAAEDQDRSSGFPIDNDLRLSWAVQRLLECLPEGVERERELEALMPFAGLTTMTKLVWFFGAQHGRFGSQPNEPHQPRHISVESVDRLQSIVLSKLQQAATDGSLASQPGALRLARDWQNIANDGAAEAWVKKVSEDDQTLTRLLLGVQSSTYSHSNDDYVATIGKSAGADFLVHWFDGKTLRQKCTAIIEHNEPWFTLEMQTRTSTCRRVLRRRWQCTRSI